MYRNPWKWAFLILAAIVLAVLITLISVWMSVTHPRQSIQSQTQVNTQGVPIEATVSLKAINQLVDMQLVNKETPVQDVQFTFENQRLRVNTSLTFFGRVTDMSVWMRPHEQPNGDLRLVAEEARIGQWPIPMKTLFAVLEGLPWPPWVHVQSEQYTLDINLSERPSSNGTRYKIKRIDWANENINLEVLLHSEPQPLQK